MLLSSSLIAVMALASSSPAQSFSTPAFQMQRRQTTTSLHRVQTTSHPTSALKMSDFGSAMPEKPELSMKEKLMESATTFIVDLEARLADGVDPPPEMEALKAARDADSDENTLALRIYELMIEQGMTYDIDAENGKLSPTQFDIKNNLDIPEVKAEFAHLYQYGMQLIARDLIDVDVAKECVKTRLIERTGKTPEEFDAWLGY
mmetsp:Transcript_14045/g.21068  ORF Transcript_14045/g.21068 Transcript_14045/m.21068 type:complete len:204 (+) Transcript_14045:124-735(+)